MKTQLSAIAVMLAATFASAPAQAGAAIGGSVASSRVNGSNFESDDVGWKAFVGGYSEVFGIEAQYIDFGDVGGVGNPSLTAWAPALVVGVPLGAVQVYGKIGEAFYTIDSSFFAPEIEDEELFYGIGLRGGSPTGIGFRVEYERFEIRNADVDLVSAGLELRF